MGDLTTFSVKNALNFGMKESLILEQFLRWENDKTLNELERKKLNEKIWIRKSLSDLEAHFSYLSKRQIEIILKSLINQEVLIKENFNNNKFDRTLWFCVINKHKIDII